MRLAQRVFGTAALVAPLAVGGMLLKATPRVAGGVAAAKQVSHAEWVSFTTEFARYDAQGRVVVAGRFQRGVDGSDPPKVGTRVTPHGRSSAFTTTQRIGSTC